MENTRLPGLPSGEEPPELVERLKKESPPLFQVADSQIFYRYGQSQVIGRGASSQVFRGYYQVPERPCAVKIIEGSKEALEYSNELQVWNKITSEDNPGSKYTIPIYESKVDRNCLYIAMEMADCSMEYEIQHNLSYYQDHLKIIRYLRNIAAGLECLHNYNIVHRDIKPQNILICVDSSTGNRIAKIGDFGLSRILSQTEGSFSVGTGTEMWMAPEVLKALEEEELFLNTKAIDIFSFGMVAFYCIRGREHPFQEYGKLVVNIKDDKVPPKMLWGFRHSVGEHLLWWMMQKDPENRPTIQQCLGHPFLWEDRTKLELLLDVVECLKNPDFKNDLSAIRSGLDISYKFYFEYRWRGMNFNWMDVRSTSVDLKLLELVKDYKDLYDPTSIISYLEFVTDLVTGHNEILTIEFAQDLSLFGSGPGREYSERTCDRYFVELYPEIPTVLFCLLCKISPDFTCLEKLKVKYFERYIGYENIAGESKVKYCMKIFSARIRAYRAKCNFFIHRLPW